LVEVTAFFEPTFSVSAASFWWIFLVLGLIIGIVRAWPRLSISAIVQDTDCSIELCVCDMFGLDDVHYVVSCNTTFDTSMDDGTIARDSVQGQFTNRFFSTIDQIDREIMHSLEGIDFYEMSEEDKPYGKKRAYPIGTVATVRFGERRAYLVAIAELNRDNTAHTTRPNMADALPRLWEHIKNKGDYSTLCCPILGSGRGRINAKREELVQEIVRSFIPAIRSSGFCKSLIIPVNPKDFAAGHVDFKAMSEFLTYECKYGSSSLSQDISPVGTAQG